MITEFWTVHDRSGVAVQLADGSFWVMDVSRLPATAWHQDVLGAHWFPLVPDPDGVHQTCVALEQA
jgi:hypothetical protein